MKKVLLVTLVAMLCGLSATIAGALDLGHNFYAVTNPGHDAYSLAAGSISVDIAGDGSFTGTGAYGPNPSLIFDCHVFNGQITGNQVSYDITLDIIGPSYVISYSGRAGEFAFVGSYSVPGTAIGGVTRYSRLGATGWVGTWTQETQAIGGASNTGTLEITSAVDGILTGQYLDWGDETPTFTGTYSPDGTFSITVPAWGNCTTTGVYGFGWNGYSVAPGDTAGFFLDTYVVPEPSALVALLSGLAGVAGLIRRKH